MKSVLNCFWKAAIVVGVGSCLAAPSMADDAGQMGYVRISKPRNQPAQVVRTSATSSLASAAKGPRGQYSDTYCDNGCDNQSCSCCEYLKCKFGYFIPTGGGGQGIPWVGHYSRVYPVDPYHADSRDGSVYAAQGYGVPISVPLAPVVGHQFNYGWGIPSSRLTPISYPAY